MLDFMPIKNIIDRIISLSEETYYNPYNSFVWPKTIEENQLWMSRELLSVSGTEYEKQLTEEEIYTLSKWESINFYSLNVNGIRDLLIEMLRLVHKKGYEEPSRYFHYFIGEENEHMYFFSKFCLKYGDKIYNTDKKKIGNKLDDELDNFLIFVRILFFEEIVDYYNQIMANDKSLHPIIREINKIHHQDESRHISFNRGLVKVLYKNIKEKYDENVIEEVHAQMKNYLAFSLQDFYNPSAYRDAGLKNGLKLRNDLLLHPARKEFHQKITNKLITFLQKQCKINITV
ncbi:diiron oxygenase [Cytobacillus praedii]|uniref:diiron oxygenase n=1 Tax=Cytobacillus praedii TaxID=1742358 RepID=UPI003F8134A2